MRVLLLGEYSGFHGNLKKGLKALGHEAVIVSSGDGFKKLSADINVGGNSTGVIGKAKRIIYPFLYLNKYNGFDVTQFINTNPFTTVRINKFLYKLILRKSGKKFLSACGDDPVFFDNLSKFRYNPYQDDITGNQRHIEGYTPLYKEIHNSVINKIDGIIPVLYEYSLGYKENSKVKPTIPLPIDVKNIPLQENIVKRKIVFFHGLNRESFKGTSFIKTALFKLRDRYPNDVEVQIKGKMPLDEYLNVLSKTNVVLDQCKGYSYAMNALYSMSQSKIVLGGAEPEALNELNLSYCPVKNIIPSVNQIFEQLIKIMDQRNQIPYIGNESRSFVEEHHEASKIAQKYIDVWSNV